MWMQDGFKVCMDSYMASKGSCFMVTWTIFPKPTLGGRPNTKPGDDGTPNAHNHWFILFYHVWGPAWIKKTHWNSIWLRAPSHMASYHTWGSVTTQYAFEGVLGWPLDTFFWALTISWSRLLARVWSGPKLTYLKREMMLTVGGWEWEMPCTRRYHKNGHPCGISYMVHGGQHKSPKNPCV